MRKSERKICLIRYRLPFERSTFKYQKAVYFIFIMICNNSIVFYQPQAHMKKTLLSILTLVVYFLGSFSASAEDHKHKLHEIGERIKQAVKAGKITEKEGWAKWHAVLREHGHDEDDDHHDEFLSSVEFLGNNGCSIPDYPWDIFRHTAVMTHDGIFLVCGGNAGINSAGHDLQKHKCLQYDPYHKSWSEHSTMIRKRKEATAVSVRLK